MFFIKVNPTNGSSSDSWFDFLSRSNPLNEHQHHGSSNSGGRRSSSSSSTWPPPPPPPSSLPLPRNGDGSSSTSHIEVARHQARDVDDGLFDGRKKESGGEEGSMNMNEEKPVLKCEPNAVVEGDKGGRRVSEGNERSEDGDKIKI